MKTRVLPDFRVLLRLLKKLCITALAAVALTGVAKAADMPVKAAPTPAAPAPLFNWSGWYIGAQGGYAWGKSRLIQGTAETNWFDTNGGFGGGTLGFNWQTSSNWVWGIETDISKSGITSGTQPSSGNYSCGGVGCETKVDWFGTTRGRLGYAWDRLLVYGTGGWAYGEVHSRIINDAPGFDDGGKVRNGWTAGGGLEWAFAPNWSAKVEYLHVNFGKYDMGILEVPTPQAKTHFDLVRVGLNWRFGDWWGKSPVVAKY